MTDEVPHGSDLPGIGSPHDVFALLGHELRVDILYTLWEGYDPFREDDALPFSELRDRVGLPDSGQFNYHLDQLTGQFVRRTDGGYELTNAGLMVALAVVAGTASVDPEFSPAQIDATCYLCGAPTVLRYEDEYLYQICTECEGRYGETEFRGTLAKHSFAPAGLKGREPGEVLEADLVRSKHRRAMMAEGVCPNCSGAVDSTLRVCEDHDPSDGLCEECGTAERLETRYLCPICKWAWQAPPRLAVATHPVVVSSYYERGVEFDVASYDDYARTTEWDQELVSAEPAEVRVTVPFEDGALELTLDEEMELVDASETP